jgi:hypothetical protein
MVAKPGCHEVPSATVSLPPKADIKAVIQNQWRRFQSLLGLATFFRDDDESSGNIV